MPFFLFKGYFLHLFQSENYLIFYAMKLQIKKSNFISLLSSGQIKIKKEKKDLIPDFSSCNPILFNIEKDLTFVSDTSQFSVGVVNELLINEITLEFVD